MRALILCISIVASANTSAQNVSVVEYYSRSLDAFFITGRANEQASLDAVADFQRTGMSFSAQSARGSGPSLVRICRFYISTAQPFANSHFYGREGIDCEEIRQQNLTGFTWEDYDFAAKQPVGGVCPNDTVTIRRSFRLGSVGKTPNHRYTAGTGTYESSASAGYVGEGAAFCVLSAAEASSPKATVTIRSDAATILRDGRVTLTWSSTNAVSCVASGSWGGHIAAQGSQRVVVTAAGSNVFEIACTSAGGLAKANVFVATTNDPSKQVMIPSAVTFQPSGFPANYPSAFRAAPSAISANDPYCAINADSITIPSSYLGSFPLPVAKGTLPKAWFRSVGLKDYYPMNPSSNNDCAGGVEYARAAYLTTLDRVARVGADAIWVYNYARWKDLSLPVWDIELSDLQIKDDEMTWLVVEAAKRGLRVFLDWQLDPRDMKGNAISSTLSAAQLTTLLNSYKNVIVARAQAAQLQGIAGMHADWSAFWLFNANDNRAIYSAGMLSVVKSVRAVFSGKIGFGWQGIVDQEHLPYIDFMRIEVYPRVSDATNQNLSVDSLRAAYLADIRGRPLPKNVPVLWSPLIQSSRNFYRDGWVEDGFCVTGCPQYDVQTDYSVQALGMEAMFQAISEQTTYSSAGFQYSSGYWLSDATLPSPASAPRAAFPNFSQSIRNKPAEAIMQAWFRRN